MKNQNTITPKQLRNILRGTIPAGLPTLTAGAPGIGKSQIHTQVACELGYKTSVIYPAILDPADIGGLPVPVGSGESRRVMRLLDDTLLSIADSTEPTLLLIDELGQASPAMQAAVAPVILDRRIGKHRLGDNTTVAVCTNRVSDRAGAGHILTHLISRMASVLHLSTDLTSWTDWAVAAHVNSAIVSLVRWRPALLSDFDADQSAASIGAYPCPRSWVSASRILALRLDAEAQHAALVGAVGAGATAELTAHLLASASYDLDAIYADPSRLKLPKEISTQLAIVTGLAARAKRATANKAIAIADRLMALSRNEYVALYLRDTLASCPDIYLSADWQRAMQGPIGQVITNA